MDSWSSSDDKTKTVDLLSEYFKPNVANVLLVKWNVGDAAKMLNRTNDIHQLSVSKKESSPLDDRTREDEALGVATFDAYGKNQEFFSATLQPLNTINSNDTKKDSTNTAYSYTFTLTRTKYCTRIRQDLQAAIKSRRSD